MQFRIIANVALHKFLDYINLTNMLYAGYEPLRLLLQPMAELAKLTAAALENTTLPVQRVLRANSALLHRVARTYPKPPFAIDRLVAHGHEVAVTEEVIEIRPFCRLVRFARHTDDAELATTLGRDPRVLLVAPLSGHHATLLRDTITTLLADHDVYVTDWTNARDVPVAAGTFPLAAYVAYIRAFITRLGARDLHVIAVCQPTVPVLAAVSLDAIAGVPTPCTLTLMGGPVDARKSPTEVNKFATQHDLGWFERTMIHHVPANHVGAGRRVYPGFIQLTAFVQMNASRHAEAYRTYWFDALRGDNAATAAHERFYDEYNAVLDMDADYYLDTVRMVFQEFGLANGTWEIGGELVRPAAIRDTAILTVEGDRDDISGLGQTAAAHDLCSGVPSARKHHLLATDCGHYGIFSGHHWREQVYPRVREHIRSGSEP